MNNIIKFEEKYIDDVMDIWLSSNNDTHDFLEGGYWEKWLNEVRSMLPNSDLNIYAIENKPIGFVGVIDNYIAGIFVYKEYRGQGIGKKLLEFVKNKYETLTLDVYEKNKGAYKFYLNNDFKVINKKIDKETNENEVTMKWIKS